jgi:fibronectin type 3 domain-containing protein
MRKRDFSKLSQILFAILAVFISPACSLPAADQSAKQSIAPLAQFRLLSYTATQADVNVTGQLPSQGTTLFNSVSLYSELQCSGIPLTTGLASQFQNSGLKVSVPLDRKTSFYLKTNTLSDCFYIGDYQFFPATDLTARFTKWEPSSPSKVTLRPLIFGEILAQTTVEFYSNSECSSTIGLGSADEFSTAGVFVDIQAGQLNKIYAQVKDSLGNRSNCQLLSEFMHTLPIVNAPIFHSSFPTSPHRSVTNPRIKGQSNLSALEVSLFSDPGCVDLLSSNSQTIFETSGIEIQIETNQTQAVYARASDEEGNTSSCSYLTTYIHDSVPPQSPPVFFEAIPTSPTRLTIFPKLKGQASLDSAEVKFFSNIMCFPDSLMGSGNKSAFENTGISVNVLENNITSIYAQAYDSAGNSTSCVPITNYKHNTIPPLPPFLGGTDPQSPNNITAFPKVFGETSPFTHNIYFFSDEQCQLPMGTLSADVFNSEEGGVISTPFVPFSTNSTTIYVQVDDIEGNVSDCTPIGLYEYSTAKSADPTLLYSTPASPTRITTVPWIIGSAPSSVTEIKLYDDSSCVNLLGQSTRSNFTSVGIQTQMRANTNNYIYSRTKDRFNNYSDCNLFMIFTHDNQPPLNPVFTGVTPLSPNNTSLTPTITGTTVETYMGKPLPTNRISLYDSFLCLNRIGFAAPSVFATQGMTINAGNNIQSNIYAQASDSAGNTSQCTFMTNYIYTSKEPGVPTLISTSPTSPSYSERVRFRGEVGPSESVLPAAKVEFYSDMACANRIAEGSLAQFTSTNGINLVLPLNTLSPVFARIFDSVGNVSSCTSMTSFRTYNQGPQNLTAQLNPNGSVVLSWQADLISQPSPRYIVKRSLIPGGPYSILSWQNIGTMFTDLNALKGRTYYYVVSSTNATGYSLDSNEVSTTVSPSSSISPISLLANPGPGFVDLSWTSNMNNMIYQVLRSTNSAGPYTAVSGRIYNTGYTDNTVVNGVVYYYRINAINQSGQSMSSEEVSALPLGISATNPRNLKMTLLNYHPACGASKAAKLSWTAPDYFSQFNVRGEVSLGSLSIIKAETVPESVVCVGKYSSGEYFYYIDVQAVWGGGGNALVSGSSNYVVIWNQHLPDAYAQPTLTIYPGDQSVKIIWSELAGASAYNIWRSTQKNYPSADYQLIGSRVTGSDYTDTSVVNGVEYFYYVQAVNTDLGSEQLGWPSEEVSAIPRSVPVEISYVSSKLTSSGVELNWVHSSHANYYKIFRASASNPTYVLLKTSPVKTTTDTPTVADTYYYYVKAVWGQYESPASPVVTQTFHPNLSITGSSSSSQISVSFIPIAGISTYKIWRSATKGGPYTTIATVSSSPFNNSTSSPAGFPVSTTSGYYYRVVPVFAGQDGVPSNEVSGQLTPTSITHGLTATDVTPYTVTLEWIRNPSATQYNVYRSSSLNGPYSLLNTVSGINGLSFTAGNLLPGVTYYFKVANRSCALSCLSNAVTVLTLGKPSSPTAKAVGNSIKLDWMTASEATSYFLQRSIDGVSFSTIVPNLTSTPFVDSSVSIKTFYYYRLGANFSDGSTYYSDPTGAVYSGYTPDAPTNLKLVSNLNGTDVILSWTGVPEVNAYKIYQSLTSSNGPWIVAASVSTTQADILGLTTGLKHYFKVVAIFGDNESGDSNIIEVYPLNPVAQPAITLLSSGNSTHSIKLDWPPVGDAAVYDIYRSNDSISYGRVAQDISLPSWTDTSISPDSTYYYYFTAKTGLGFYIVNSLVAGPISIEAVPKPVQLRVEGKGLNSVKLTWTNISINQITQYNIYRSSDGGQTYSLISSVPQRTYMFTDDGLTLMSDHKYFYYVKSLNSVSKESLASNIVSLQTSTPASFLSGTAQSDFNHLSWVSDSNAVKYRVLRGETAGGPYRLIAELNNDSSDYQDNDVVSSKRYFYVIQPEYADSSLVFYSNEIFLDSMKTINLQFPIEMVDYGLASDLNSARIFERTRTSLDTEAYDGSVTFDFEVIASNSSATEDLVVSIVGENDNILSSVSVPAQTTELTRFKTAFIPATGFNTYRVKLSQLSGLGQVRTARIWVNQLGATKSKIYIPLLSSIQSSMSGDQFGMIETISNTSYANLSSSAFYKRLPQQIKNLQTYSPWELEAVVSRTGKAKGLIGLINQSTQQVVPESEIYIEDDSVTMINSPFADGGLGFNVANNNQMFRLGARCFDFCETGGVNIYRAGLWISLENITETVLYVRASQAQAATNQSKVVLNNSRIYLDINYLSNPVYKMEAAFEIQNTGLTVFSEGLLLTMLSAGNSDSENQISQLTEVSGSGLAANSRGLTNDQSGSLLLNSNERYVLSLESSNQTMGRLIHSFLSIHVQK